MLKNPTPEKPASVRMSDYSPELERLTDLVDRVNELIQATIAVAGVKPKSVKAAPRPTTVLERVRKRNREKKHRDLVARLLPHKAAAAGPTPTVMPPAEPVAAAKPVGAGTQWLRRQRQAPARA